MSPSALRVLDEEPLASGQRLILLILLILRVCFHLRGGTLSECEAVPSPVRQWQQIAAVKRSSAPGICAGKLQNTRLKKTFFLPCFLSVFP